MITAGKAAMTLKGPSGKIEVITSLKFYDRHHDLVNHYRTFVSQMTTYMFRLS